MDWRPYIEVDPHICHGRACVAGTRIMIAVVLDNLAVGVVADELVQSYPGLTPTAVQAVIAYAADLAREREVPLTGRPAA